VSNYSQITFFAPKDALLSGNPAKIIYGAQVDPELNAISVAIATKYDSASISSGQVPFGAGTAAAPSITFASNLGTGLYLPAANSLGFTANGVAAGAISSAGAWSIPAASAAISLAVTGAANSYSQTITASSTSGQSLGLNVLAGTTSGDTSLLVQGQSGSPTFLKIFGDGHGTLGPNTTNCLSWTSAGSFTVTPPANGTVLVQGSGTLNQSYGLTNYAGTSSSDAALRVYDTTATNPYLYIYGDGSGQVGPNATNKMSWSAGGAFTIAAPTGGFGLIVNGLANSNAVGVVGAAAPAGQSFGLYVKAGTNGTDAAVRVFEATGTTEYFHITGAGAIQGHGPTAAALVDMTPDKGTFTGTLTGCTTAPTATFNWVRMGNIATIYLTTTLTATSNSTSCTITGLPAALTPTNGGVVCACTAITNNGSVDQPGAASVSGTTITLYTGASVVSTGFTNVNAKGLGNNKWSMTYPLA
jgi:hypothetical protein